MTNRLAVLKRKYKLIKGAKLFSILNLLIPLLITDFVIIGIAYHSEATASRHSMENMANAVDYSFYKQVDFAAQLGKGVYTSRYVNDFINKDFESNLEYFGEYHEFFNDTLIELVNGSNGMKYTFYIDNPTIISGSEFQKIDKVVNNEWYKYMRENDLKRGLYFGYENRERKIYFFQQLNFYDKTSDNVLLIDINYSAIIRSLENLNYDADVYICDDDFVLLSNGRMASVGKGYASVDEISGIRYSTDVAIYGKDLTINVVNHSKKLFSSMKGWWFIIIMLVLINILLPINMINTNTIKAQEMVVARQKAELLALHSQINPHFLFNALESIRMHSLIKHENETAAMVERLAKLQRQYTEWKDDLVAVNKEMEFVTAYLELQKYRFGERLSFDLDVDEDCGEERIPKLSIVTFVENACVHGIESKNTPGWIFVRISKEENHLVLEIEDTGNGMNEEEAGILLQKMQNASIEMLKEKGRVGIVNACLRLKMVSSGNVVFGLDTEEGTGTIVTIKLPL